MSPVSFFCRFHCNLSSILVKLSTTRTSCAARQQPPFYEAVRIEATGGMRLRKEKKEETKRRVMRIFYGLTACTCPSKIESERKTKFQWHIVRMSIARTCSRNQMAEKMFSEEICRLLQTTRRIQRDGFVPRPNQNTPMYFL